MKTVFNKQPESREIGGQLQQAGYRLTLARKAVIRTLTEAADWLSPEQIHQQARRFWGPLGLVTVYRTLALLLELGFVRRVHSDQRCLGYARTELAHGHYLLCRSCHQAVEFPGTEDLRPLVNRISRATGFLVDEHLLELHGLCPACQAATPAS
jgi:Fe2+ or Zn2+ uptake regulation protein